MGDRHLGRPAREHAVLRRVHLQLDAVHEPTERAGAHAERAPEVRADVGLVGVPADDDIHTAEALGDVEQRALEATAFARRRARRLRSPLVDEHHDDVRPGLPQSWARQHSPRRPRRRRSAGHPARGDERRRLMQHDPDQPHRRATDLLDQCAGENRLAATVGHVGGEVGEVGRPRTPAPCTASSVRQPPRWSRSSSSAPRRTRGCPRSRRRVQHVHQGDGRLIVRQGRGQRARPDEVARLRPPGSHPAPRRGVGRRAPPATPLRRPGLCRPGAGRCQTAARGFRGSR